MRDLERMEERECGKFVCDLAARRRLGEKGRGCSSFRIRSFLPLLKRIYSCGIECHMPYGRQAFMNNENCVSL